MEAIAYLKSTAAMIEPERLKRKAVLLMGSHAGFLHFPFTLFLAKKLNYPDSGLIADLAAGMPIVGDIGATPNSKPRTKPATMTYEQRKAGIPERNIAAIGRANRSAKSEFAAECWGKTECGISKGWLSTPVPLTDKMAADTSLAPRYLIREQHGEQKEKSRVTDDLKARGIIDLMGSAGANITDNLDISLAAATYYKLINSENQLIATSADYKNAYKTSPWAEAM